MSTISASLSIFAVLLGTLVARAAEPEPASYLVQL